MSGHIHPERTSRGTQSETGCWRPGCSSDASRQSAKSMATIFYLAGWGFTGHRCCDLIADPGVQPHPT
eukprot:3458231-Pyramimonas_sp.AAC.1